MLFKDDGSINIIIVIPIILLIIICCSSSIYFLKKKSVAPIIAPTKAPTSTTPIIAPTRTTPIIAPSILKFPVLNNNNSNTWTISNNSYGNGTYITTTSNITDTILQPYLMFNGVINKADSSHWRTTVSPATVYNDSTGVYTGSQSLGGVNGDWVNLKLPYPITLKSYTIYGRDDYEVWNIPGASKWWQVRSPKEFVILGSNDGSTWTIVDDRRGNNKAPNWTSVSQSFTTNNNNKYSNYTIVITRVGNDDLTTGKGVGCIQELELYGY